jgi:hypothetical protein
MQIYLDYTYDLRYAKRSAPCGASPRPAPIARPEGRASFRTPYGATFSRKREKGQAAGCARRDARLACAARSASAAGVTPSMRPA